MKFATTKTRLIQYLDIKGITKKTFFEKTLIKRGFLDSDKLNGTVSDIFIANIIAIYSDINIEWLLTGNGNMLKNDNIVNEPTAVYSLRTDNKQEDQRIPLYDIEAAAGLAPLFNDTHHNPIDYITIPNLPKCDGALSITGDSMYPLLKSGDIVMYKQIQDFKNDVFFGEMYLISVEVSGEEHIMVKYIQKSDKGEKYLKLVSYNQNHQSKDVMIGKVRAMALIKASIRINSMN